MWNTILLASALMACTTDPVVVAPPDAAYDYFGETCTAPANPEVVARCHNEVGVCVDSVCRPVCAHEYPPCPGGVGEVAASGLCYCAP